MKKSIKSIDTEEWRELWEEFWARERSKHIKGRKRMWKEVEREEEEEVDVDQRHTNLFSDSSDSEEEENIEKIAV